MALGIRWAWPKNGLDNVLKSRQKYGSGTRVDIAGVASSILATPTIFLFCIGRRGVAVAGARASVRGASVGVAAA